jgi:hypothetical protein
MFNNEEYAQLSTVYMQCIKSIKEDRTTHRTSLADTPVDEFYTPFLEVYKQLTGIESEFDPFEIDRHHYLARWKKYRHDAE